MVLWHIEFDSQQNVTLVTKKIEEGEVVHFDKGYWGYVVNCFAHNAQDAINIAIKIVEQQA